jgi:hypothetical protein
VSCGLLSRALKLEARLGSYPRHSGIELLLQSLNGLGIMLAIIRRCVLGCISDLILQLGDTGQNVVDGFLALAIGKSNGLEIIDQVLKFYRPGTVTASLSWK